MEIVESIALIPTTVLLSIIVSQYLIVMLPKRNFKKSFFPSISILIPAHNEGKYLRNTIISALRAKYRGRKEIIVVNDGSTDNTQEIINEFVRKKLIKGIRTNHIGKSNALNKALKLAKNEIIVSVDGDCEIKEDALINLTKPFTDEKIGAVSGITRVKNRGEGILAWFQNLEYAYFSYYNSICEKINAVLFTPGVLSAYRKAMLEKMGGFPARTLVEDCDTAFNIHKLGYRIAVADDSIVYTVVPTTIKRFVKQRVRWARGVLQTIKLNRHFLFNKQHKGIGFYAMPILGYWYFHAIIMGVIILYQIFWGYYSYFYIHSNGFSLDAAKYFFYWFSFFGIINLCYMIFAGTIAPSPLILLSIVITFLSYGFYLYSFSRYERELSFRELFALLFYFPYILMILFIQVAGILLFLFPTRSLKWSK